MCSICGCWSHLACYVLEEGQVPELFFCLFCQISIVKSVRRRLRAVFREVDAELERMQQTLRPVTTYCQQTLRITGITDIGRIARELERAREAGDESLEAIRGTYQEAQKLLESLMFVKKQGDGMDGDEWQDGGFGGDAGEQSRHSDAEEDDRGYSSEVESDQSSS